MQSLGITITLNSLLQTLTKDRFILDGSRILSDILTDEKWEGIAYVALYDEKGTIVLHSNPNLIGEKGLQIDLNNPENPHYHRLILGTGEEIFSSDTKIKIQNSNYILRVALHLYPTKNLLKNAETYLFFILTSAFIITLLGIFAIYFYSKIEQMQIKMKELEKLSMFSSVLAHEVRNPLGSIKGFAQHLLRKISEPKFSYYLEIIIKESQRLERLVDELSDYANPHKIKIEEVNLKELLDEIVLNMKNEYNYVDFELQIEEKFINTDRDKLTQIIQNLVKNAIDAVENSIDKKIIISMNEITGKIKIEIIDRGIGMDENILKHALDPFFTTKPKGTGLGLAIVARLCEILKIDLKISSKKNEGTRVCLIIPKSL